MVDLFQTIALIGLFILAVLNYFFQRNCLKIVSQQNEINAAQNRINEYVREMVDELIELLTRINKLTKGKK